MNEPRAERPFMPGYGLLGPDQGTGLLPWSWAKERLLASRNYWLVSRWPDGRPHAMPVWGVWSDGSLWFSSSRPSRKSRNLQADPRCVATTEDPMNPVVLEGTAEEIADALSLASFLARVNAKYQTNYGMEMVDPASNCVFRLRPRWAFGLKQDDFTGSPTRWIFTDPLINGRLEPPVERRGS